MTIQIYLSKENLIPELVTDFGPHALSRVFGATQDKKKGIWRFPAYWPFVEKVIADLTMLFPDASYSDKAVKYIQLQEKLGGIIKTRSVTQQDQNLFVTTPYQHQLDGISLMAYSYRNGLLYDRGLGKTKIAIDTLMIRKSRNPLHRAIVLTLPVVLYSWEEEVVKHSGGRLKSLLYHGSNRHKILEETKDWDILITTYETAKIDIKILQKLNVLSIIADESQKLRRHKSGNTKSTIKLAEKIPYRTIMSGSATLGDPTHLYGQMKFLSPLLNPETYSKFCDRFLQRVHGNYYAVIGYKNLNTLNSRLMSVSDTKNKEDCLDLPDRVITDINFDLSKETRKIYNGIVNAGQAEIRGRMVTLWNQSTIVQIGKLMQITSGFMHESLADPTICDSCLSLENCVAQKFKPYTKNCIKETEHPGVITHELPGTNEKIRRAAELVNAILNDAAKNKVIVWANYNYELELFYNELTSLRKKAVDSEEENTPDIESDIESDYFEDFKEEDEMESEEILFLTGGSNYKKILKKFNEDKECRVLAGQVKCGIGITANAASYMLYLSLPLDLEYYLQSMDRNYRIGQDKSVTVYRMLPNDTLYVAIASLLDQKENVMKILTEPDFCERCRKEDRCFMKPTEPYQEKGCSFKSKQDKVKLKVEEIE